ncbi:MAG TPA: hypothetical protein VF091_00235 [Gaiellaceae bacterium]
MRRRPALIATVALVVAGGAAAALVLRSSSSTAAVGSECGTGVAGRGFRVFACESGGAGAGHPHPKELLVVRADGSSAAYHAFRLGGLAVGKGEVVAIYDIGLVRVTSNRLVPLVTQGELARALHIRRWAIMDIYDAGVDAQGDAHFVASVLRRPLGLGCKNSLLERTAAGAIRQIRASTTPDNICR